MAWYNRFRRSEPAMEKLAHSDDIVIAKTIPIFGGPSPVSQVHDIEKFAEEGFGVTRSFTPA